MTSYYILQSYWWFIVSLLGALLVFMLFVQGGQSLIYSLGKTEPQLNALLRSLGKKWELTFTTLVTFGGAFFASFPLFYSTSFGGAYWCGCSSSSRLSCKPSPTNTSRTKTTCSDAAPIAPSCS